MSKTGPPGRKKLRNLEIDILALSEKEQKAYVMEVKSNPDRKEYIEEFLEKLKAIPEFLPQLAHYALVGIYAGLTMSNQTVAFLTGKRSTSWSSGRISWKL